MPTPLVAWEKERRGLEVLADATSTTAVTEMAEAVLAGRPSDDLRRLLTEAAGYEPPQGVAAEVRPWVDQMHAEATVAIAALDVLEGAGDPATLLASLLFRWPRLSRSDVSVFGPRRASVLRLTQDERTRFAPAGPLFVEDANATDRLVRAALGDTRRR